MQGQRGAIGSLPETLSFEHDSTEAGAIEHQICWNNNNNNNLNTTNQETPNVSIWSMGESSSSPGSNPLGSSRVEPKPDHGWPSLTKTGPEPHRYEPPPSMLSLGDVNMNITHNHVNMNSNVTVNPSSFMGIKPTNYSETYVGSSSSSQLPCKRKSVELSIGQSSSSGIVSENPLPVSSENPIMDNNHRNVRLRINNPSPLPDNSNNNSTNGQLNLLSYPSLRLNPVDLTSPPANSSNQEAHRRLLRRNLQVSSRWNRGSSSRTNRSSNISTSSDNSRTNPLNISDHPIFIQPNETRNAAQNSVNWSSVPAPAPPHYPSRRLSEILRRNLLSLPDSGPGGGQNSNLFSRIPPTVGTSSSSSSQDPGMPPVIGMPGHHHHHHLLHSRSSDRQIDGAFGFPYLSRTMVAGSEGRGRLVSEIRNVLDLIRRGEGLRYEDVMILDRTFLHGMADIHDRHRDMRLDIDNMSYEELLALEERIGNVNTGLTEETISTRLKQKTYLTVTGQQDAEPCCICQEEYQNGDDLGALECGHDFHKSCVKQWLLQKNLCPVCKSTAFATNK